MNDYERGKKDALDGMPKNPRGSKSYGDYIVGYEEGERIIEGPDEIDEIMNDWKKGKDEE